MYEIKMNEKSLYTLYLNGKEIAFFFDGAIDNNSAKEIEKLLNNNEAKLRDILKEISTDVSEITKLINNAPPK